MTSSLRASIICLLCIMGSLLSAQTVEEDVRRLFAFKANIEWVRSLEGAVNNIHPMQLHLGYDGSAYRGLVTYEGIEAPFELQGTRRGDVLTMQELDSEGNVTGVIKGHLERDRFNGAWWSDDMTRSADVSLMDRGLILLERFEPRFMIIEGNAGDQRIDFALSMESPLVISGTWQRSKECVRVLGECDDFLCDNIRLIVLEGEMSGAVISMSEAGKKYSVKIHGGHQPLNGSAEVTYRTPLKINSAGGYHFLTDMAYPEIRQGNFESWIGSRMDTWYNQTISNVADREEHFPSNRWSLSASGWIDIYLYEDDLLSGMLTYFDTDKESYAREAFIYDLRDGREVELSELDKRGGTLLKQLQSHVRSETRNAEDFVHVMLCESGFVLSTDFDSVEGDEAACVPFDKVEDILRKRSTLAKLED